MNNHSSLMNTGRTKYPIVKINIRAYSYRYFHDNCFILARESCLETLQSD